MKWNKAKYKIISRRFIIDRIENLFLELNINFSSRENSKIDMEIINKKYNSKYHNTFISDYQIIYNIYNSIGEVLKHIRTEEFN